MPLAPAPSPEHSQFQRLKGLERPVLEFTLNGQPARALQGDTVMTAILTQSAHLRCNEFSQLPRAGFCVMGACQDCWVRLADGRSIRACQSPLEPGMSICTGNAQCPPGP